MLNQFKFINSCRNKKNKLKVIPKIRNNIFDISDEEIRSAERNAWLARNPASVFLMTTTGGHSIIQKIITFLIQNISYFSNYSIYNFKIDRGQVKKNCLQVIIPLFFLIFLKKIQILIYLQCYWLIITQIYDIHLLFLW